jgi:hypothetical protein
MADDMNGGSVIRIELTQRLDPLAHAQTVHGCWVVLVAAGYATIATIHTDSSATDQELDDVLSGLIEHLPWGW